MSEKAIVNSSEQPTLKKLPEQYRLVVSDPEETGIRLFGLKDAKREVTTYFAEFNENIDVHSLLPWAGASVSRSDKDFYEIFNKIVSAQKAGKYTAAGKLANVFVNYGHASVADMSPIFIYVNKIPMHEAFWIFNHTSVGGGQELSTRYVKLDDLSIPDLNEIIPDGVSDRLEHKWRAIQDYMVDQYNYWFEVLHPELESYLLSDPRVVASKSLKTSDDQLVLTKSTVVSRTLDVTRMWIPLGAKTSMAYLTSTRNMIDIIAQMRTTSSSSELRQTAEQLRTLLSLKEYEQSQDIQADLAQLTKYDQGSETLNNNLEHLSSFLDSLPEYHQLLDSNPLIFDASTPRSTNVDLLSSSDAISYGELLVMQYISVLHPNLPESSILNFLHKLDWQTKSDIGRIIFADHNHHDPMRNPGDIRGAMFSLETSVGYLRDLNRHRAFGRLAMMLEQTDFEAILAAGFNKNEVIEESTYWNKYSSAWNDSMGKLYSEIYELHNQLKAEVGDNYNSRILFDILPLAHQTKMHLSSPLTQYNYLIYLRTGRGGDMGYRLPVYNMLEQLRKSDPYLTHMGLNVEKPDVNDVEQLLGRS